SQFRPAWSTRSGSIGSTPGSRSSARRRIAALSTAGLTAGCSSNSPAGSSPALSAGNQVPALVVRTLEPRRYPPTFGASRGVRAPEVRNVSMAKHDDTDTHTPGATVTRVADTGSGQGQRTPPPLRWAGTSRAGGDHVTAELTDPTLGSSEPDRFWTLANASEACPLVMSPLCWTLWLRAFELGTRGSLHDFGILPRSEVYLPDDPNEFAAACFHGRLAMNVDKLRTVLGTVPGSSADDFERDLIGRARPDAPVVPDSLRRLPFIAVRTPWSMLRQGPRLRRLHDDQLAWWQANVLDPAGTPDPRALLRESDRRFQDSFRLHLYARANLLMAMQAQLTRLATAVGGADLVGRVIGGVGGISETDLATHLWELSRGRATREEFIRRHGFHGPSGGSPIARSWRENPEQIDRLAAAYADRPDEFEPRVRERAAVAARTEAARELLHGL